MQVQTGQSGYFVEETSTDKLCVFALQTPILHAATSINYACMQIADTPRAQAIPMIIMVRLAVYIHDTVQLILEEGRLCDPVFDEKSKHQQYLVITYCWTQLSDVKRNH